MEVLILPLLQIIAIIVCYMICKDKNRTAWKGIIAGTFLGWIGVIVCICLKKK